MQYSSLKHITCNEGGDQEVEIVYAQGFWRTLLRLPERIEVYVAKRADNSAWHEKGSGLRAGAEKEREIRRVLEQVP